MAASRSPGSGPSPTRIRAFVAFPTPESLRVRLADLMRELQPRVPRIRFVRPEGVHVTLRFLGPSTSQQLDGLEPRLREAAALCPKAEAGVFGLRLFPGHGAPRVLWIGLALPEPILGLQTACEKAAVQAGFAPADRPFHPHLTLGRWKDRARRPELPEVDLGVLPLEMLVVYRSELRRAGAVYTPLATFGLCETAGPAGACTAPAR